MRIIKITFFLLSLTGLCSAQHLTEFQLTDEWMTEIAAIAPSKASTTIAKPKKLLIFSLHTGFEHWTIPHTEAVVKLIAEQSGAFKVTVTKDVNAFSAKNLAKYDAIVLNNNCSKPDKRDLFWDALAEDKRLDKTKREAKAKELESNLIQYVSNGGGLIVLHGAIVMQNNSVEFSKMIGGSFDYHPKQQTVKVKLVDPKHPLVHAFDGKGFEHLDEPYFFKGAYENHNFNPLLYMEVKDLSGLRDTNIDNIRYISWIKSHGNGRVFYCSPSHNAQSYKNPQLLQFILDGMQYTAGDLKCDDKAMSK